MGELFLFILIGGAMSTALCVHLGRYFKPRRLSLFERLLHHAPPEYLTRSILDHSLLANWMLNNPERYHRTVVMPPVDTGNLRPSMYHDGSFSEGIEIKHKKIAIATRMEYAEPDPELYRQMGEIMRRHFEQEMFNSLSNDNSDKPTIQ